MNLCRAIKVGLMFCCVALSLPFGAVAQYDPYLLNSPVSQTVQLGETAIFNVTVQGTPPLIYQWRKDGTNVFITTNTFLSLTNVQWSNRGDYDVIVTNSVGSVTSAVATLAVNLTTLDSFNPTLNGQASCLAVQGDGKIFAGGDFSSRLIRLNIDGTLDTGFSANANASVRCLAMDAAGSIFIGGDFSSLGGYPHNYIARFYTYGPSFDGYMDGVFDPPATSGARALACQPDGKIIVSGYFGTNSTYLSRLNPDGSLDPTFNAGLNGSPYAIALQPDGRIVIGGYFTMAGGGAHTNLARLETNGIADPSFNASSDSYVWSLALQADGKILAGGAFVNMSGQPRRNIARLNGDGSLDATFNPGVTNTMNSEITHVYSLAVQTDGRILVGGIFNRLAGITRNGLAASMPTVLPTRR